MDTTNHHKRITLYGLVQGIGFRPYVARLAMKWGVSGLVCNLGGAVRILAAAPLPYLEGFLKELQDQPPPLSEILHMKLEKLDAGTYHQLLKGEHGQKEANDAAFHIVISRNEMENMVILPADLPVCDTCLSEMKDTRNRRFGHLLISCTHCGPRYSIIKKSPYDREHTTMDRFDFCPECKLEYTTPESRRFHAQTVSCHQCGPQVKLVMLDDSSGIKESKTAATHEVVGEKALERAAELISKGHVMAVKGIGGYHFIASPYRDATVKRLREIKHRDEKPFALCFPDMEAIRMYAEVTCEEEELLSSKARPIVLLESRKQLSERVLSPNVLKNSRYMGAFLAYTPILVQLCGKLGPLIATSANLSDAPIIHKEDDMISYSGPSYTGLLTHDREIVVSQDDSVAWVVGGKPQTLRRARGYTPLPVYVQCFEKTASEVLAFGGELKSTFCLQKGPLAYVSQYLGDLGSKEALDVYEENLVHMKALMKANPLAVACDLHPDYATTRLAEQTGLPIVKVQHHHAHIAAVMAEKNLSGPVIGLSFDGTGYGADGTLWGGEFLVCEKGEFIRAGYLKPLSMLMGDDSMKDCEKTLTAYLHTYGLFDHITDNRYPIIRGALDKGIHTLASSSMGRLFDAVSCLLGLCRYNSYEGEAAILLENAAYRACQRGESILIRTEVPAFDIMEKEDALMLDPKPYFTVWAEKKIRGGVDEKLIDHWALAFHRALLYGLVEVLDRLRHKTGIRQVVLSGGVFQNKLLVEGALKMIEKLGLDGYISSKIPPNDGGISLGQAFVAMHRLKG